MTLPLTIEEVSNPAALAGWVIKINGQIDNGVDKSWNTETGALRVFSLGTLIVVR